ncbi:MAG: GyrI-like domain-containing protein, partial [Thermoplasmata archaeon]|nr:GyrI-like domain-containing protein [Thermoplasmata archaeon]
KEMKHLYLPSAKEPTIVDVPEMRFIMVDGEGDPNVSKEFQEAVEALYGLSYTLKFNAKKNASIEDWVVMPLEGLWRAEETISSDMSAKDVEKMVKGTKGDWHWTLMIAQPDSLTEEMYAAAAEQLRRKKNPPALSKARFEAFAEGKSVQIMHVGPYSEEWPNIRRMHEHAMNEGKRLRGRHHEIYLSDPRRTKAENLKTVLRHPVEQ